MAKRKLFRIKEIVLLVVCLVVALHISQCRARLHRTCSSASYDQSPRGICGRTLSDILATLCTSGYNKRTGLTADSSSTLLHKLAASGATKEVPSPVGLTVDGRLRPGSETTDADVLQRSSDVFVARRLALSLLRSRRHAGVAVRRGIHCECCIHRCSVYELMEYCRSDESSL